MDKEKFIWLLGEYILDVHDGFVGGISIHEHEDSFGYHMKIYSNEGYCWELRKELDEVKDGVNNYNYYFSEPWDEFIKSGIDKAIEILNRYVK